MDAFIGEIRVFGQNWTPEGWLPCLGQQVTIQQYQALFTVIGSHFGPYDGRTFTIPNLQGLTIMGAGSGPGLTTRTLAQKVGTETVTLTPQTGAPAHNHVFSARNSSAPPANMSGKPLANQSMMSRALIPQTSGAPRNTQAYDTPPASSTAMGFLVSSALGSTAPGGVDAHSNVMPSLVTNYYICWSGTYPTPE